MFAKLTILFLFSPLFSSSAQTVPCRTYYAEEEDMFRVKTLLVDEGDGKYHEEDLTVTPDPNYKVFLSDVTFFLYTMYNSVPDIISAINFEALEGSHFKPARKNVFIIHGWTCDYRSPVNTQTKRAILRIDNVNVFVVDWSGPANGLYITAKTAVPDIGKIVGDFINKIISKYNIPKSQFYLIGHSLGAHIAGCAGAVVDGVHSIVGLDPAGPLFTISNTDNRLDPTDGEFVQVIHTNGRKLGFGSAIGHVDYYPDGGTTQNECGNDPFGQCSHGKAYEYYAKSIIATTYNSTKCSSYKQYLNGVCEGNPTSLMGKFEVDRSAGGDYFLTVSAGPRMIYSITLIMFVLLLMY